MLDLFTPILPQSKLCESFKRISASATSADSCTRWPRTASETE
ncbi:hypothetical protein LMG26411_04683 [Cupriavidus numazuensis]|uniref:Uncharacterized protein n=1 Tax=Cupriavidus numazuensis TaxID=221992 RepID=A0ABM8TMC3_9BURK|nr:hypothetical protein LMG26411_04683 [Cupriavidus numazuensis]